MSAIPTSAGNAIGAQKIQAMNEPVLFITDPETLLPNGAAHWDVGLFTSVVSKPGSEKPYNHVYLVFQDYTLDQFDGFCFIRMLSVYSHKIGRPITVTVHSALERMYDCRELTIADSTTYTINGELNDEDAVFITVVPKDYFVAKTAEGHDALLSLVCLELDFDVDFSQVGLDSFPGNLEQYFTLSPSHTVFDCVVLTSQEVCSMYGVSKR